MKKNEYSFIDYIHQRVPISAEIKTAVSARLREEIFDKNHFLHKEGLVSHRVFFITSGSARTFYIYDGKEVTSWIYREGQLVTCWSSFYTRTPSSESIELTEKSQITSISHEDLFELYGKYSKIQAFGRVMVEQQLVYLDQFYKGYMYMSAREKYDLLLSIFPDVILRVNLGHIASFLGISQETLSRVRRKT